MGGSSGFGATETGLLARHGDVDGADAFGGRDFDSFVRLHSSGLLRTAYLLTGNPYNAEDLLQATLTDLLGKWAKVTAAETPLAYVRQAMTNRFLSGRRTKAGNEITLWDIPDRPGGADVSADVVSRHEVLGLLETLSSRQRSAVVLRYFHDLPDHEIAAALGCRAATVRSLISRGLTALGRLSTEAVIPNEEGGRR